MSLRLPPPKEHGCQRRTLEEDVYESEPETQLLRRIAQGDSAAFWKVWEAYRPYLYTLCLKQMGGIHTDAEDALSRTMIKAVDRLPAHADKIRNLKAWLARLTNNLCIDMHRESRREARGVDNIEDIAEAYCQTISTAIESPEEMVLRRETGTYLYSLIKRLPPNLYEPFVLHFFHGESYTDIAVQLDLSNDNVRKRIQQARAILREGLAKNDFTTNTCHEPEVFLQSRPIAEVEATEITPPIALRLIRVTLSPSREMTFEVPLNHQPQQHSRRETLEKYVRNYPRGWKRRWDLACILLEMGLWESALREYRYIVERKPRFIDAHLYLAQVLHLVERDDEAIAVYERALTAARNEGTRHHLAGLIAICRRQYDVSIREFQLALLAEPQHAVHRQVLGLVYLHCQNYRQALQAFAGCLKINPDDVVALTYSVGPLLSVARTREAEDRLVRAVEIDPANGPAIRRLAVLRSQRGVAANQDEVRVARQGIHRGLRLAPLSAEARESLAMFHIFRGEWSTGVALLRNFTEKHPGSPAGWANLACWLFRTGAVEAATQAVMQGNRRHPVHWEMHQVGCEIFTYTEDQKLLQPLLEELLAHWPDHWNAWVITGLALIQVFKNQEEACTAGAIAAKLQPQLPAAWFEYGRILALCNRYREALAALENGWRWLSPGAADKQAVAAALLSGESLRRLGEEDRARIWFERAAQKALTLANHSPALAYYRRGQALEALGDTVGAIQAHQAAIDHHLLYPWRREARRSLERLQSHLRSPATA
jgi:RNA polymerase sigma factor (sigma-70 family)